jgi:hypothetical protein
MSTSYDQLRYSFDNILKELDDICKSIDDLTDVDNLPPTSTSANRDTADLSTKRYQNFQLNFNIDNLLNSKSNEDDLASLNNNSNSTAYEIYRRSLYNNNSKPASTLNRSSFPRSGLANTTQSVNKSSDDLNKPNLVESFNNSLNYFRHRPPPPPPSLSKQQPQQNPVADRFKAIKLPKIKTLPSSLSAMPSLNTMIGSAQEAASNFLYRMNLSKSSGLLSHNKNAANNALSSSTNSLISSSAYAQAASMQLPLATPTAAKQTTTTSNALTKKPSNNFNNYATFRVSEEVKSSSDVNRNKNKSRLMADDSASANFDNFESFDYEDHQASNKKNELTTGGEAVNDTDSTRSSLLLNGCSVEDRLTPGEVSKIECFYNSMGCFVYVCRSVAELYQLKREDEFDSMDNDPVHDYHEFVKRKESLRNGGSGGTGVDASPQHRVSYMYINSGVPVIVFNYGVNPKRNKDMRILLAERATGFCMFEFKFDCVAKLLDSGGGGDVVNVVQLKLNENPVINSNVTAAATTTAVAGSMAGGSGALQQHQQQQNSIMLPSNTNQQQPFNYHNEYFERYFGSKNRHARKEHLLKFIVKRGEFFLLFLHFISINSFNRSPIGL